MRTFELGSAVPASMEELYAWHARPGAFERLNPPWDPVEVRSRTGQGIDVGVRIELRVSPSPISLVSRHVAHASPEDARAGRAPWAGFVDEQERGPFARWRHEHRFTDGRLVDHVEYALLLGIGSVDGRLRRLFAFRHRRTVLDLERHAPFRDRPRLRVAIAGGTGLLGGELAAMLSTGGHDVRLFSRREAAPGALFRTIRWDPARGVLDPAELEGVDAVVNLAGEPLAARWTADRRAAILASRVESTALLAGAIARLERKPAVFLTGSAVGIYGDRGEDEISEASGAGEGFLAEVATRWEAAAEPARAAGVRVVHLRTGIALSARGGLLGALLPLARAGGLGPIGGGRQYVPWIALDDWVGAAHHLLWADVDGPVNLVAPEPVPQAELARAVGRALGRPAFLPTPGAAVSLVFGAEGARELVLAGQRARPARLLGAGFTFAHASLDDALAFELGV